ncbi:SDR family NAD(P)-dependent oxidoreductase [Sulfidibacter corallicola]|uniref:SDR family NAD(P)-dependent oxidoreductase n=1 Tax=Sulfidibacter corallicola TaxID=2818388 RepID=A0A8A4TQ40_SULCO|nr:SDR family NAD(P)-dependent oxidoreductase [Sulfidibacter corallicola]QTD51202.1 SDR family NAD(P)-dependent oxidoreductase [Sulfidibacter corallicola]
MRHDDRRKIFEMVQRGTLSPAEAARRLAADDPPPGSTGVEGPRALLLNGPQELDGLNLQPIQVTAPAGRQVGISVRAFSLNFADLLCVQGLYPNMPDYPFTPGLEIAGEVVEVGAEVDDFKRGDRVLGLMGPQMGGHAEWVCLDRSQVVNLPDAVSFEAACAFPMVFLTAYHVFELARLEADETILIQTAAGGVGLIAVQMARRVGAKIIATAGSPQKLAYLASIGVDHGINYCEQDLVAEVARLTQGRGVDVVLDTLAGETLQQAANLLAPGGRWFEIAMTGLRTTSPVALSHWTANQAFFSVDLGLLARQKPARLRRYLDCMMETLSNGDIQPTIFQTFPFEQLEEAYRALAQRANIGKVVVQTAAPTAQAATPKTAVIDREPQPEPDDAVAVIAMAGRFPGGESDDSFWQLLREGRHAISEITRWPHEHCYDPQRATPNTSYCKYGGFLKDIAGFDAEFFDMSGREAQFADPQHRLLLESCWQALERGGYAGRAAGLDCGVFAGIAKGDYTELQPEGTKLHAYSWTGNTTSIAPARIAYFLDLKGPAIAIDTACSSSLVAIHQAKRAILGGDCRMALAGGVFLYTTPYFHIMASNANMLSIDGRCRTFDADANGFVPGEGVGVVLLKRLAAAQADGDPILAVLRGSAVNQDGRTNGITAPSSRAQIAVLRDAYADAGLEPRQVGYVEAHGTATKLGDPIEVDALSQVFGTDDTGAKTAAIGSVKTNIGHTATAAGMAGVFKLMLCLKHRTLVPSLGFNQPNPHIDFDTSPFEVCRETRPWPRVAGQKLRAAVSSFGFSGTNAHLIFEEPPRFKAPERQTDGPYLVPFSARSEAALRAQVTEMCDWLQHHVQTEEATIADIAFTRACRRPHFEEARICFLADAASQLSRQLARWVDENEVRQDNPFPNEPTADSDQTGIAAEIEPSGTLGGSEPAAWAARYNAGRPIDFAALFNAGPYRTLDLPTYPFQRRRYWLDPPSIALEQPTTAPGQTAAHSAGHVHWQRLSGETFYIQDHGGMLPGVMTFELVRRAVAAVAPHREIACFKALSWATPLLIGDHTDVGIRLEPSSHGVWNPAFALISHGNGDEQVHARGQVLLRDSEEAKQLPQFDLCEINGRMEGGRQRAESYYARVIANGGRLGSRFKGMDAFYSDGTEALAHVSLLADLRHTQDHFGYHPTLFDGAFQAMAALGFATGFDSRAVYLPYSLASFDVFDQRGTPHFVYITPGENAAKSGEQRRKFSAWLLDEQGQPLFAMHDFVLRPLNPALLGNDPPNTYRSSEKTETDRELCLYQSSWTDQIATATQTTPAGYQVAAVVAAAEGQACREQDSSGRTWLAIEPDTLEEPAGNPSDASDGNPNHRVAKSDRSPYAELVAQLANHRVVLLDAALLQPANGWCDDVACADLYQVHRRISALLRALLKIETANCLILVIWPSAQAADDPCLGALIGLARGLAAESSRIRLRLLLSPKPLRTADTALIETLEKEASCDFEPVVDFTGRRRVARLTAVPQPALDRGDWLQPERTYLISGGLGGLGLVLARYLAGKYRPNLVLCGRRPHTSAVHATIAELEDLGGRAVYVQADLAEAEASERLIQEIQAYYGPLHGVFHCAGNAGERRLGNDSAPVVQAVLAPKLAGTVLLDQATRDQPLDFFLLYGSTTAWLGFAGQADYGYANDFLNHFANWREQQREMGLRRGFCRCIGWPLWQDGGMQLPAVARRQLADEVGIHPLPGDLGLALLTAIENIEATACMVLYGERARIADALGARHSKQTTTNPPNPDHQAHDSAGCNASSHNESNTYFSSQPPGNTASSPYRHNQESGSGFADFARQLRRLVVDLLQIDPDRVNPTRHITEYGFDSMSFTELAHRLNQRYHLDLTPDLFFDHDTLAAMAEALWQKHAVLLQPHFTTPTPTGKTTPSPATTVPERLPAFPARDPAGATASAGTRTVPPARAVNVPQPSVAAATPAPASSQAVAVVGMAAVLPGSPDLDSLWDNLISGRDLIGAIPRSRWSSADYPAEDGRAYGWAGLLDEVACFDPAFFNISPLEAEQMDPQLRLFLQTAWHAIEAAGYRPSRLAEGRTGVFVGATNGDYVRLCDRAGANPLQFSFMLANRVSFFLNFKGPSESIDTACSSSLVAVHRALTALQRGECDTALVGGVSLILDPHVHQAVANSGALSPSHRCKSFDAKADGYVRGEGVAALLLKPLSQAMEDGDCIRATLLASAVNHGGRASSPTVPNPTAQAALIEEAYRRNHIDPATIGAIEVHGTGTKLGDPLEINGLKRAFVNLSRDFPGTPAARIALGTIKSSVGHLEPAAGIAGLLRILLALRHKTLPGNIHLENLNPYVDLSDSPFFMHRDPVQWPPGRDRAGRASLRRAGISSFGIGGTNAHVIVEEAPPQTSAHETPDQPLIFPLSARDEASLRRVATAMRDYFKTTGDEDYLADIAYTLQVGREPMRARMAFTATHRDQCIAEIEAFLADKPSNDCFQALVARDSEPPGRQHHDDSPRALARTWVSGTPIDWSGLAMNRSRRRVPLPAYSFAKEHYWLPAITEATCEAPGSPTKPETAVGTANQKSAAAEANSVRATKPAAKTEDAEAVLDYLKTFVSDMLKWPRQKLDVDAGYDELGMDSMLIERLNGALKKHLPKLPSTLFFSHKTLRALADHLTKTSGVTWLPNQRPVSAVERKDQLAAIHLAAVDPAAQARITESMAIVGLSGRYPMAPDLDTFWENLRSGRDCVTEIPRERWDWRKYAYDEVATSCRWGGFLEDVDCFDPQFFKISPLEARYMDPQERLFLQTAWHCFEDAGYAPSTLADPSDADRRAPVGVFVGVTFNNYQLFSAVELAKGEACPVNSQLFSVANRVSYSLNLSGPSLAVDTACSSSLYALHLACESIRNGECRWALAGGVNLSIHPSKYFTLGAAQAGSSSGHCHAFGEGGDGYVPAEAVGSVLLRPLSDALAARDRIYGCILGSAVNHDGRTHGYTVPNPNAQADLVKQALQRAGVAADTIGYVEAHGTGTKLGDPIEVQGLTEAIAPVGGSGERCTIGSVKANIGHAEAAAGISQLTKVLLQLKHTTLVPSPLFGRALNPNIDFTQTPFDVALSSQAWPTRRKNGRTLPRRAGISSFGVGGVNVHMIVEEAPQAPIEAPPQSGVERVFCLSAKEPQALRRQARDLRAVITARAAQPQAEHWLQHVAWTLQTSREAMNHRLAWTAATCAQALTALDRFIAGNANHEDGPWFSDAQHDTTVPNAASTAQTARAWVQGTHIDWRALWHGPAANRIALPNYPFRRDRYWLIDRNDMDMPTLDLEAKAEVTASTDPDSADDGSQNADPGSRVLRDMAAAPSAERIELMQEFLSQKVVALLELPMDAPPDWERGFFEMGMDSVLATRLYNEIEQTLSIALYATATFDYPNVSALAEYLVAEIDWRNLSTKASGTTAAPEKKFDPAAFAPIYFTRDWETQLLQSDDCEETRLIWLLDNDGSLYLELAAWLEDHENAARLVLIQSRFAEPLAADDVFGVDPTDGEDWRKLVEQLNQRYGRLPDGVIHAWTRQGVDRLERQEHLLESGLYSIFHLTQTLSRLKPSKPLMMLVLSQETHEGYQPANAAVSGFAKSLAQENPRLGLRHLALEPNDPRTIDFLFAELQDRSAAASVRYRGGERQVEINREVQLDNEVTATSRPAEQTILITGGAGGLGLLFARQLIQTAGKTNLVLLGRSTLDEPKQAALDELQSLGATVAYLCADVSDRAALAGALSQARRRFGAIEGIIHAAGQLRDSYLTQKSTADFQAVLEPKIKGLCHLDELTREDPLRYFVAFSSTVALFGNAGQCDYAAANAFMDHYLVAREQERALGRRNGRSLALNWPLWQDGGMCIDDNLLDLMIQRIGLAPLQTALGWQVFEKGLAADHPQLAMILADRHKCLQYLPIAPPRVIDEPTESGILTAALRV